MNIFRIEVMLDQTGINCDEPTAPTPQIRIGYSYTVEDIFFVKITNLRLVVSEALSFYQYYLVQKMVETTKFFIAIVLTNELTD